MKFLAFCSIRNLGEICGADSRVDKDSSFGFGEYCTFRNVDNHIRIWKASCHRTLEFSTVRF